VNVNLCDLCQRKIPNAAECWELDQTSLGTFGTAGGSRHFCSLPCLAAWSADMAWRQVSEDDLCAAGNLSPEEGRRIIEKAIEMFSLRRPASGDRGEHGPEVRVP
jgi:hypothetical protein